MGVNFVNPSQSLTTADVGYLFLRKIPFWLKSRTSLAARIKGIFQTHINLYWMFLMTK